MNPFLIALIMPVLHAVVNHVDKYLLSKYLKSDGIGALILFSSLFAIILLPIILFIEPGSLYIPFNSAGIMMGAGFLYGIAILFYLFALNEDEASTVAPFFQLIPVVGYIFGVILLKEILSLSQLGAGLLIILGAVILSLEQVEGAFRVKKRLLGYIMACVIPFGLMEVLFKFIAIDVGYWEATFWHYTGYLVFGVLLFVFHRGYRTEFISLIKENTAPILGLNFGNETLTLIGDRALALATLLAPVAIIQTVLSYQAVFVFLIGILLTKFLPGLGEEDISRGQLIKKSIAIVIIVIGSALLYF